MVFMYKMAEQICRGNDIKYTLAYINKEDIQNLKNLEKKYHEIVGYGIVNDNGYSFYSVEDNYTNSILNHWTVDILNGYDNHTCWIVLKTHPCNLYGIMTDLCKPSNSVFHVDNFDVWKTKDKNCLVAVITDIEMD